MNLTILYRGPLSSCNYGCLYCPFAKQKESSTELALDEQALTRFVTWIVDRPPTDEIVIFFTPWGEALIRPWYQQAINHLSHLPQITKVVIQTNLSATLDWLADGNHNRIAVWATYHPEWVSQERFLRKCDQLELFNVRYSVGMVGFPRFKPYMQAMRHALPDHVYLWINAVKKELPILSAEDYQFFQTIDPLFHHNTHYYPSYGQACHTGASVISVDGTGAVRRCHFIKQPLGNLYEAGFEQCLQTRPCSNQTCHCHIGYVHLDYLGLDKVFGMGILERIPINL